MSTRAQRFEGWDVGVERPNWAPLLALVGVELTGWFMWMGEVELSDGARVHVYKHRDTRRSVHVAEDGRTFYYDRDGHIGGDAEIDYVEMPRARAIWAACRQWPNASDGYGDHERLFDLVDRAVQTAHQGNRFPVDPAELELQRAYEAKGRRAA